MKNPDVLITVGVVLDGLKKTTKEINSRLQSASKKFQGWAMSIMFFGMAMQKAFMGIWKSSSKAFQEVMNSVENSTNGFNMLEGSIKFLQFTIGSALEPIAMLLIPIIDKISNWVSQNEGLARTIVVIGIVLGTVLFLVGTLTLAFVNGIIPAVGILVTTIGALGAVVGTALGVILGVVAGIIVLIVAMWVTNFGGIRDFVKETFGIIFTTIKSIMGNVKEIFKGVFELIKGLFTGDFDLILVGLVRVLSNAVGLIAKVFLGLGGIIGNIFIFVINVVKDLIFSSINILIGFMGYIGSLMDKVFGTDIAGKFDGYASKVKDFQSSIDINYISKDSMNKEMSGVDDFVNNIMLNVEVQLDGDKVAESVSSKVVDRSTQYTY